MPNPTSPSPNPNSPGPSQAEQDPFAGLPTETEIYILPTGEIVIADLPAELAQRLLPNPAALAPVRTESADMTDVEPLIDPLSDPHIDTHVAHENDAQSCPR